MRHTTIQHVLNSGDFDVLCGVFGWNHYHCEELDPSDTISLTCEEWASVFGSEE